MTKCELTIGRMFGFQEGKVVRIDVTDGPRLLSRVEVDLENFAAAVMGLGRVPATHTTVRPGARDRTDPEGGIPGRAST